MKTKRKSKHKVSSVRRWNKHRLLLALLIAVVIGAAILFSVHNLNLSTGNATNNTIKNAAQNGAIVSNQTSTNKTATLLAGLFPRQGFKTQISLGNIVPELVASGAINLTKVSQLYNGNLTQWQQNLLTKPSTSNLTLNASDANFYLLVFWAFGISNKNPVLDNFSKQTNVSDLASVGGWTLGTNNNAMAYFDNLSIVNLTPAQQAEVQYVAMHTYRPCCNNPTGFPDCNHGAALLALIEIGASQGLNESQLYSLALEAQTLWFPSYYAATAVELQAHNISYWNNSQTVLGRNYSSISGWYYDVYKPLNATKQLPTSGAAAACGA